MVNLKKLIFYSALAFVYISTTIELVSWPKKMVITDTVADLRNKINSEGKSSLLSQLIFGEKVIADKEKDGYLHVNAIGQKVYSSYADRVIDCPGWIRSEQAHEVGNFLNYNLVVKNPEAIIWDIKKSKELKRVLIGTRLYGKKEDEEFYKIWMPGHDDQSGLIKESDVISYDKLNLIEKDLRSAICEVSEKFLESPYLWGGRSIYDKELDIQGQITGSDCSNLVALCYKIYGKDIPRNTRTQKMKCKRNYLWQRVKACRRCLYSKNGLIGL